MFAARFIIRLRPASVLRHGRTSRLIAVALLGATAATSAPVSADDYTWSGTTSNNWEESTNWTNTDNVLEPGIDDGTIPDGNTDSATIANPDALLLANRTIGALTIQNNGDVLTGTGGSNFSLIVQDSGGLSGLTLIENSGSTLTVFDAIAAFDFDTDDLTINDGGDLVLSGGIVQVDDTLQLNIGGDIRGQGIVEINGSSNMVNDGLIVASGGTLTIQRSVPSTAKIDPDGSGEDGSFQVDANSVLIIDLPLVGPLFDGTMTIGSDAELQINSNWTLTGTIGTQLDFNGGAGTAILSGSPVASQGIINVNSGTAHIIPDLTVTGGKVEVAANSTLQLDGTVSFNNGSQLDLDNSNTALIVNGSTMISNGTFNWDGADVATSTTTIGNGGSLWISVTLIDAGDPNADGYDGTVTVNSGTLTVQTTSPWRLDGIMNLNDVGGGAAVLNGSPMILVDTLNVSGDADVNASLTAGGNINVSGDLDLLGTNVFESTTNLAVGAGSRVILQGPTTFMGGSYTGAGEIVFNGDVTIANPTTIDVDQVNLDGFVIPIETLTLNAALTLNVDQVDVGINEFNGDTIEINGNGRLEVNLTNPNDSWIMDGILNINAPVVSDHVDGSDVELRGTVNVDGTVRFGARVDITGTIATANLLTSVLLNGAVSPTDPNTIDGGTITGSGQLRTSANNDLVGNGTIETEIFFTDASLMATGGTLLVDAGISITGGTIGTLDSSGILNVTSNWDTSDADELRLNGGAVTGSSITNDGTTAGFGLIGVNIFTNDSVLSADGGTLVLDTTGDVVELDGDFDTGVINAVDGSVHVIDPMGLFPFNGQLNVGAGREFRMDSSGLDNNDTDLFNQIGEVNLSGGTYVAPQLLQQSLLNVTAATSTIDSASDFASGGTNSLDADLQLVGSSIIRAQASFLGTGDLVVTSGATLNLASGASVGVELVNFGEVQPGLSTGSATADRYTQDASGRLAIEINGFIPGDDFGVLNVSGTAVLDGGMVITLGFLPSHGDSFQVMTFASRSGVFSSVTDSGLPNMLVMAPFYTATDVTLSVELLGDASGDGKVNPGDYTLWANNFGHPSPSYSNADFNRDGVVNAADYTTWANKFGAVVMGPEAALAAVPEPSTWVLLALGLVSLVAFRRRLSRGHADPAARPVARREPRGRMKSLWVERLSSRLD